MAFPITKLTYGQITAATLYLNITLIQSASICTICNYIYI